MPPRKAPDRIMQWVKRLLKISAHPDAESDSVEAVLADVRAHYNTDCSVLSKVSLIRRLYMDAKPGPGERNAHEGLAAYLDELRAIASELGPDDECAALVRAFVDAPLKMQYHEWRRQPALKVLQHGRGADSSDCRYTEPVQAVFRKMKVLPDVMDAFKVDPATVNDCMEDSYEARMEKNENMSEVQNADDVVRRLAALLDDAEEQTNMSRLIIGLCACSGRRMGEIVSPRSSFAPMPGFDRGVTFGGQLKKAKLTADPAYDIPLIGVTSSTFLKALRALRAKQGDVDSLTNDQLSVRYQSNARKFLLEEFPQFKRVHELRAFYAAVAYKAFEWQRATFPRVVMYLLGHTSMTTFFNYNAIEIHGLTLSYGPFPWNKTGSRIGREKGGKDGANSLADKVGALTLHVAESDGSDSRPGAGEAIPTLQTRAWHA